MSLELERERAVQALASHFAQDHLTTQELELRFEKVYRAASTAELQALLGGLPVLVPSPVALETLPQYSVAPAATVPREKRYLALMGEVRRKGNWTVPSRLHLFAAMGAIRLDLREAQVPAGGVDSTLDAPVIRVKGMAFMGAVRVETRLPSEGVMEAWKRRLRGN